MKYSLIALSLAGLLFSNASEATLIRYYPFDGNANDATGNSFNGTVVGASLTSDRFGNPNSAYQFDGNGNYIVAAADNLPTVTRTVAFWFEPTAISGSTPYPVPFSYGGGGCGTSFAIAIYGEPYNSYGVAQHCSGGFLAGFGLSPENNWHHLAVTTNNQGVAIYLDGSLLDSTNQFIMNVTGVTGTQLSIGVMVSPSGFAPYTDSNVGYYQGLMDDIRIYDTVLSGQEIAALAADRGSSVPEPTTAWLFAAGLAGWKLSRRYSC